MTIDSEFDVNILTEGEVPEPVQMRAIDEMTRAAEEAPRPVIFARVKLIRDDVRATEERYLAQGVLDMSGTLVRAQVAAPSMPEAVDAMAERVRRQLRRVGERWQALRRRPPRTPEGEWRSGDLPSRRPSFYPRPAEEREVVRRKTYGPHSMTPEDAAFNLAVLDHRFYLFTNSLNGEAGVVYRDDDGDLHLRQASGGRPSDDALEIDIDVDATPAAEITLHEAKELLDTSAEDFVFFDPPEGDGPRVLYRRYDGHYGLIEPQR